MHRGKVPLYLCYFPENIARYFIHPDSIEASRSSCGTPLSHDTPERKTKDNCEINHIKSTELSHYCTLTHLWRPDELHYCPDLQMKHGPVLNQMLVRRRKFPLKKFSKLLLGT